MRTGGRQNFCRPPVRIALDDEKPRFNNEVQNFRTE